jgi:hypothetical protein
MNPKNSMVRFVAILCAIMDVPNQFPPAIDLAFAFNAGSIIAAWRFPPGARLGFFSFTR